MGGEVWVEGCCFKRGAGRCDIVWDMVQQRAHLWKERETSYATDYKLDESGKGYKLQETNSKGL